VGLTAQKRSMGAVVIASTVNLLSGLAK